MDVRGLDRVVNLLAEFLDVQSRRAQVVASNLANADTPGYQAQELEFAQYLKDASQEALTPHSANNPSLLKNSPRLMPQTGLASGLDGNNVDAGHEMATLSEVGMSYLGGTGLLQARLRTLRSAIREGR